MDTRKLKDKASQAFTKGNFEKAAEHYEELAQAEPKDLQIKVRLGDTYARAKRPADAVRCYREVVDRYARDGLLLKAIAVCKTILQVDAEHGDTQALLADLYGRKYGQAPKAAGVASRPAPAVAVAPIPLTAVAITPIPLTSALDEAPEPSSDVALDFSDELPQELQAGGGAAPSIESIRREAEAARPTAPPPPARPLPPPPPAQAPAAAAQALEDRLDDVDPSMDVLGGLRFDQGARSPSSIEIDPSAVRGLELPGDDDEIEVLSISAGAPSVADELAERELPQMPLFSELGKSAFVQLLETCELRRLEEEEAVITAGEIGRSFFVVVSGKVKVVQLNDLGDEIVLASLGEGAFFGEMALLSGAPRVASVIVTEPVELLEFTKETLGQLVKDHPSVQNVLRKFYRQRLLTNVLATSPMFRPFDKNDRKLLIEKFKARDVERGEAIIEEGQLVDGLYVVLSGEISVSKREGSRKLTLASLHEGDVFGEMSLLTKAKAAASCVAKRRGTVLRLPRKSFEELILTHPQVLEMVAELSEERQQRNEAIRDGKLACDEEGLVLV